MTVALKRICGVGCLALLAAGLAACGAQTSTASFKGEQHAAAQVIANLQTDAAAGDEHKVCTRDLASTLVKRLGGTKECEHAIKSQLAQVDNLEVDIRSIRLTGSGGASAQVRSVYSGKGRTSELSLVKQAGKWKISGLG